MKVVQQKSFGDLITNSFVRKEMTLQNLINEVKSFPDRTQISVR